MKSQGWNAAFHLPSEARTKIEILNSRRNISDQTNQLCKRKFVAISQNGLRKCTENWRKRNTTTQIFGKSHFVTSFFRIFKIWQKRLEINFQAICRWKNHGNRLKIAPRVTNLLKFTIALGVFCHKKRGHSRGPVDRSKLSLLPSWLGYSFG